MKQTVLLSCSTRWCPRLSLGSWCRLLAGLCWACALHLTNHLSVTVGEESWITQMRQAFLDRKQKAIDHINKKKQSRLLPPPPPLLPAVKVGMLPHTVDAKLRSSPPNTVSFCPVLSALRWDAAELWSLGAPPWLAAGEQLAPSELATVNAHNYIVPFPQAVYQSRHSLTAFHPQIP